jgi:hypothetical protein
MDPLLDRVATQRLINQRLTRPGSRRPEDVVAWLGAVQAQEYAAARWGVGQRMAASTDADVRRAVDAGRLLRTHVMRPTWHFVARDDIRWMLELTAPRVSRIMSHYIRRLELDARLRTRAAGIFERVLGDGPHLTRGDLGVHLARGGVVAKGLRLAMLTMHAELEGVICSGAYRGRELTYALLAERAPRAPRLAREEALAELTRRFFPSHAPRRCATSSGGRASPPPTRSVASTSIAHAGGDRRPDVLVDPSPPPLGSPIPELRRGCASVSASGLRRVPRCLPRSRCGAARRGAERHRPGRSAAVSKSARHRRTSRRHVAIGHPIPRRGGRQGERAEVDESRAPCARRGSGSLRKVHWDVIIADSSRRQDGGAALQGAKSQAKALRHIHAVNAGGGVNPPMPVGESAANSIDVASSHSRARIWITDGQTITRQADGRDSGGYPSQRRKRDPVRHLLVGTAACLSGVSIVRCRSAPSDRVETPR